MNTNRQISDSENSLAQTVRLSKQRWRSPSIGAKLFVAVMGGALVGLGGVSFFFYQTLEQQAKNQIRDVLIAEVNAVESKILQVKQATRDIGGTVKSLQGLGLKEPEVYQSLLLESFQRRPQLSMGAYFLQSPFGVVTSQKWFAPYFYADQKASGQIGKRLPAPNDQIILADLFKEDNYPNQDYYKIAAKSLKETWTEPFDWYGITMTSFLHPTFDRQGKFIGLSGMDVNVTDLAKQIRSSVIRDTGYFAVISEQGNLLSYPPNPAKAVARESYQKVTDFQAALPNIKQARSGMVRIQGKYWAYQRLSNTNWLMVAVVPESVVLSPILTISITGTLGAGLLLALVVLLFAQRLNRRLEPILDECNKLAQADTKTLLQMQTQDEVGRLSTSFYNLLAQVNANEEQIRQEAAVRLSETQERLKLANAAQEEGEALQTEVNHILEIVSAVETGDLTVHAEVSDRATGLVADTLNRLIEELARIMAAVLSTAQQVTQGSTELEQLAAMTTQQAQQQAQSVSTVQAAIVNFNNLSQQTAQQAVVSDQAVQQAQIAVTQGQQEMEKLTEEIKLLHSGTEQIVKRAQMLTNFVTSAAQFAKDQKRVATLTRVLALNASMIAARASGQQDPEQFASVAHEFETIATQVNDLAVQTNQSLLLLQQQTTQIQTVVSGINQDVQEISHSVNQFVGGVEQSQYVFELIKNVTDRVAQIGQQVTASSQAIASEAQTTLRSIEEIAAVAAKTKQQSSFTQAQAGLIDNMARSLLDKVRFFRIPEEEQRAAIGDQ
jgi:twitching motility protein PilJ